MRENGPGKAWIPCPRHMDAPEYKRPRCGLNEEQNNFNCLKCGFKGDRVGLVKAMLNVEAKEAFAWLESKFGQGEREAPTTDPIEQLAKLRRWGADALRAMGCEGRGRSVHFPMRNHKGEITGWRIRRGDGSTYKNKDGEVKALTQKGSKNGVLGVWPLPSDEECRAANPDCKYADVVLLTEGEADAAAALSAKWPAVLATPGSTPGHIVEEALQRMLAGRRAVLTPDPDEAGKRWLARVAGNLVSAGVRVAYLPQIDGKDLDKRLQGTPEAKAAELRRLLQLAIPWKATIVDAAQRKPPVDGESAGVPGGEPSEDESSIIIDAGGGDTAGISSGEDEGGGGGKDGKESARGGGGEGRKKRVEVRINPDEARVQDEVLDVLKDREKRLYQRANKLVTTVSVEGDHRRHKSLAEKITIAMVDSNWLRTKVTRHCMLLEQNKKNQRWEWTHPPAWLGAGLVSAREWPGLQQLFAVASYPVLSSQGIITEDCYDPESGWLVRPISAPVGFVERPGEEDLERARAKLHEVVVDFPFAHPAGESAWMALILTLLARPAIKGPTPAFMADASVRGSGKTMLIEAAGIVAMGSKPTTVPSVKEDEEERKRYYSLLMAGEMMVLVDDVSKIGGEALQNLLTNYPKYADRILGVSEAPPVPNVTVWAFTGNNPGVAGDVRRRMLPIRLEPKVEKPEERSGFAHPFLIEWIWEHQEELQGAALTLLAGWYEAGRPDMGISTWGSYEQWSRIVRSCLVWAGYPDPSDCRKDLVIVADPDVAQLGALLELLWEHRHEKREYKASEIVAKIANDAWQGDAAEAIKELCAQSNGSMSTRVLGNRVGRWRGRVVKGKRLGTRDGHGGFALYWAEEITEDVSHHGNHQGSHQERHPCGVIDGDSAVIGDSLSLTRAQGAGVGAGAVCVRAPMENGSHQSPPSHHAAVEVRARLKSQGVELGLDDERRLVVYGHPTQSAMDLIREHMEALRTLLQEEAKPDDMPF